MASTALPPFFCPCISFARFIRVRDEHNPELFEHFSVFVSLAVKLYPVQPLAELFADLLSHRFVHTEMRQPKAPIDAIDDDIGCLDRLSLIW